MQNYLDIQDVGMVAVLGATFIQWNQMGHQTITIVENSAIEIVAVWALMSGETHVSSKQRTV